MLYIYINLFYFIIYYNCLKFLILCNLNVRVLKNKCQEIVCRCFKSGSNNLNLLKNLKKQ